MKLKIKRGDEVVVIAGAHKGGRGKVLEILPQHLRVVVEGVNLRKRHQRKSEQNPDGGIIEKESAIHYSNVAKTEPTEDKTEAKAKAPAREKTAGKATARKKSAPKDTDSSKE